jgi:hypothetical protein
MLFHDVFPTDDKNDEDDPISEKKLKKLEGQYSTVKTLLGLDFDGIGKTMWLESAKREKSDNPTGMDSYRAERISGDTIQRVRINDRKNPPRIYMHSDGVQPSVSMQPHPKAKATARVSASK